MKIEIEGEMRMMKNKYRQELLIKLLQINSISGSEQEVAIIVMDELLGMGFKVEQDKLGNVYAVRGNAKKYPLLNAHMDIVELWGTSYYSKSYSTVSYADYYETAWEYELDKDVWVSGSDCKKSCSNCYYREYCDVVYEDEFICSAYKGATTMVGYDSIEMEDKGDTYTIEVDEHGTIMGFGEYRVLGGDDKCGIFIALEVARTTTKPMKILFTVQEEIGLVGMDFVAETNEKWFDDISYSITIDRRGANQLLVTQVGTKSCSKDFATMAVNAGKLAGINVQIEDGSLADVVILRDLVDNAINISAGYHEAHSEYEYIEYDEVVKIIKWVENMLNTNTRFGRKRYYDVNKLKKELGINVTPTVKLLGVKDSKK